MARIEWMLYGDDAARATASAFLEKALVGVADENSALGLAAFHMPFDGSRIVPKCGGDTRRRSMENRKSRLAYL
jgi:hypothetical protein